MNAVLVLIASFVMVFFTTLIFAGILFGLAAALSRFVEWVVAHEGGTDSAAKCRSAESRRRVEK
jgi:hypothetical protein